MAEPVSPSVPRTPAPTLRGNPVVAVFSAWLVPGLGHVYLKRRLRGLAFFALVIASVIIGCSLDGNLYQPVPKQPLTYLILTGDGLHIGREKLLWTGDVTGYAASASIAAALGARRHEGVIQKGDLVLSLAVGAGMNVAGALYHA